MANMLWEPQTSGQLDMVLREAKDRIRLDYDLAIAKLDDFDAGNHSTWMEGEAGQKDEDGNTVYGTGGYLQRYLPNVYDGGKGPLIPSYLPFLRRLVRLKASLFHRRPRYILTRKGRPLADDASEMQTWAMLDKQMRLTSALKEAHRGVARDKTMFVRPYVMDGKMRLDVLTPDAVRFYASDAYPAELSQCKLIMHELPLPQTVQWADALEQRWLVWERADGKLTVRITDAYGTTRQNWYYPGNEAPFAEYPYVALHEGPQQGQILAPIEESYITTQIGINVLWSLYRHQAQFAAGVGVLKVESGTPKSKNYAMGPDAAITLDARTDLNESFSFATPGMDLGAMIAFAGGYMKALAACEGIHPDAFAIDGTSFSQAITAVAKSMDRADLQEEREDAEVYWEAQLEDVYRAVRMVFNSTVTPVNQLPADVALSVEWAVADAPMSPQEAIQAKQAEFNADVDNPVDYLMRRDRMSEAQASEKVMRNRRIRLMIADGQPAGERQTPEVEIVPEGAR